MQEQLGYPAVVDDLGEAVANCKTAKEKLESIPYKYSAEQTLLNKANNLLQRKIDESNVDADTIVHYTREMEGLARDINAQYETYLQYKDNTPDYILRRIFGLTNCCTGPRIKGS